MENPIQPVRGGERERREIVKDFRRIFDEKLQSIEPVTGEDARGWASWYKDPEISEITKEVPAVFFNINNLEDDLAPPTDLWIENPRDLDMGSHYIHDQLVEKLGIFLGKSKMPYLLSAYILEDGNHVKYLVLDEQRTNMLKRKLRLASEDGQQEELAILDVLNKYNIKKVIEGYSETIKEGDTSKTTGASREIIGRSMLEKRREDISLINLAKKHKMTTSQYLRLKILADTLLKAGQQVSLDEIARSIVKDEDDKTIPVKHLPLAE